MKTKELKVIAKRDLQGTGIEDKEIELFFSDEYLKRLPGGYIFEKDGKYYFQSIGDRGKVYEPEAYENYKDALFRLYSVILFFKAADYEVEHRIKGQDSRRQLFKKYLELLKKIDDYYYQKGVEEINETLKNAPYDDDNPYNDI